MKNNKTRALENLQRVYNAEIKMAKDSVRYWDKAETPLQARVAEQRQVTYERVCEDIERVLGECKHESSVLPIQRVNAWVAVDTPPKVDYFYLVYDQDLCRITKALFDGEWHPNEDDVTVTHWMELPEPPLR